MWTFAQRNPGYGLSLCSVIPFEDEGKKTTRDFCSDKRAQRRACPKRLRLSYGGELKRENRANSWKKEEEEKKTVNMEQNAMQKQCAKNKNEALATSLISMIQA